MQPEPPVEFPEGVAAAGDVAGLPPPPAGAGGVEVEGDEGEGAGGAEVAGAEGVEAGGVAAEGEGAAGTEEDPEPVEDPVPEPPAANAATGGPGKT